MTEEKLGIIGGTGLGDVLADYLLDIKEHDINTPFGKPSDIILSGKIGSREVYFLNRHGKGHSIEPSAVPYRANIYALKKLGVTSCIASGAVGSLREEFHPGDLVVVDQYIDKTFRRDSSFFQGLAAVHCEMSHPYCNRMRTRLIESAFELDITVHESATYVCMEGPQFSSRAESLMHIKWGGDLIGMTGLPEAKLAREAQMCFALVAMPSDYDCWKSHEGVESPQQLLDEIRGNLSRCSESIVKLIRAVVESGSELCDDDCLCRKSLALAVWTSSYDMNDKLKDYLDVLNT